MHDTPSEPPSTPQNEPPPAPVTPDGDPVRPVSDPIPPGAPEPVREPPIVRPPAPVQARG